MKHAYMYRDSVFNNPFFPFCLFANSASHPKFNKFTDFTGFYWILAESLNSASFTGFPLKRKIIAGYMYKLKKTVHQMSEVY